MADARLRHDTWRDLKPGDRLVLIEKGMGLPKGAVTAHSSTTSEEADHGG